MTYSPPPFVNHDEKIVLSDGTVLSALTWMPIQADADPVPAILEYLPYRKRDSTAHRDALNHGYLAAHGYACVRVDMRGSGDSEGLLKDEYLQQEQEDALEILKWIAAQTWCSGFIGMMGISWVCSTDDRYDNDVHYMGGCQLVENFHWGAVMFTVSPTPPDPALVGDKWRKMWLDRLEYGVPYVAEWHKHQRRDEFWKHASICEDYGAIQCPVYLHLKCPKKALIGPWGHKYPNMAVPEPVGFLQESLRWWDNTPPKRHFDSPLPGRWVAENIWPTPRAVSRFMGLEPKRLINEMSCSDAKLSFCSPQTVGFGTGRWIPYGLEADLPGDQIEDARGSLTFDTQPLTEPLDIFGAPLLRLRVASDKANALVAAVMSEILPNGPASRITYGVLNLTHRDSHTDLQPLEPHRVYDVTVRLNECCQRIGTGSVIRLALSTSYFPTVWPSPEAATLTVDCAGSSLELPTRPANPLDDKLRPFEPVVNGPPLKAIHLREGKSKNTITEDLDSGEKTATYYSDTGLYEIEETGWRFAERAEVLSKIKPDDPLSGVAQQKFRLEYGRSGLDLAIEGVATMTSSTTEWLLDFEIEAFENGERIFEKDWKYDILRDHN
ncbi:Alpha/Beta hydrolase protein [Rostrohypoxylon terebratum]|nr:Alpha/Beta hydrolase protein [Rostrohypoxylon terebratum]